MELHQLRYFAAIVDEGSFTAASTRLHVSQSGVSAQLAKLERELGQQLLYRAGRTTTLTPVGKAVLPMVREALAAVEDIMNTAGEFAEAVRGPVRLGTIAGCTIPGFLDVLAGLGRTHPGITLGLTEDDSNVLESSVRQRRLDLGLIGYGGTIAPGLDLHVISTERLVAVTAPKTNLTHKEIRLADLVRGPVLCLPSGSGIRDAYEKSCTQADVKARVDVEASSPLTVLGLAERGAGTAVLPASTVTDNQVNTAVLIDADVPACLGLISRPDEHSPAVRLTLQLLRNALPTS
ncbi:LysR family transcriptional regulator [Arthrobacter sp. ISL-95]|uniref:LysR family transcriptional regulator n=1 Tax=Arthrobacter sp. ISL-95 TaxID=2819116 RepID=UPI001BE69259|nr:LysR family transcriptional regulator [Arthrobacter sp. ISL-95]MBT2588330.1 LysR family transcriptional regulator [Arthrobacter sp. ISL-95]